MKKKKKYATTLRYDCNVVTFFDRKIEIAARKEKWKDVSMILKPIFLIGVSLLERSWTIDCN